jgi:hypothetical protein
MGVKSAVDCSLEAEQMLCLGQQRDKLQNAVAYLITVERCNNFVSMKWFIALPSTGCVLQTHRFMIDCAAFKCARTSQKTLKNRSTWRGLFFYCYSVSASFGKEEGKVRKGQRKRKKDGEG